MENAGGTGRKVENPALNMPLYGDRDFLWVIVAIRGHVPSATMDSLRPSSQISDLVNTL